MSRKIFIVIAIVLVIFIIALIGYYFLVVSNNGGSAGNTSSGFKGFFPFGQNSAPNASTTAQTGGQTGQLTATSTLNFTQKLRELWSDPTAGAGLLDTEAGTVVRFVDVATGFVYETQLFSPVQTRISNTTMPMTYNAVWGNGNQSFVAQYLKDDNETIDTYVMTVKNVATTTENPISGFVLADGVADVSVLGDNLFYLTQNDAGTQGFLTAMDGLKRKQIWNSPLRELLSQLVNGTTVALTTKPYPGVPGFLFTVDNSGKTKEILANIPGLSDLVSPDGSEVLVLSQTDSAQMFLYDVKAGTYAPVTPATFPEKCVWSKKDASVVYCAVPEENLDGSSLLNWYMGEVAFTDDIWKYNLKQNTAAIVENLSGDSGQAIDVEKPLLSDSEQYLIFINKRDGSLWSLDLSK
jgi:hypothetical protein